MLRFLPNIITALRIVLVLPLSWALGNGNWKSAFVLAVIAGLSDLLDGWLARRFNWHSEIGRKLDPLADKLLVLSCYGGLALVEALPIWLALIVIGRDLIIVVGAVIYHNRVASLHAEPSILGKLTTFLQLFFIAALLMHLAKLFSLPEILLNVSELTVAFLTLWSGIDYVRVWSRKAKTNRDTK